jgi:methionine synthase II (cobalamin-independent)
MYESPRVTGFRLSLPGRSSGRSAGMTVEDVVTRLSDLVARGTCDSPRSVWRDVKLPDDKLILPGVVSHATNVVEHPDLVAERILRFTNIVGKERVIASTDCGLGGRIHPDIAWAKLEVLSEGARIATRQLWRAAR